MNHSKALALGKRYFSEYPFILVEESERDGFPIIRVWDDGCAVTLVAACVAIDMAMPKVGSNLCYRAALAAEAVACELRGVEGDSPGIMSKVIVEVKDDV